MLGYGVMGGEVRTVKVRHRPRHGKYGGRRWGILRSGRICLGVGGGPSDARLYSLYTYAEIQTVYSKQPIYLAIGDSQTSSADLAPSFPVTINAHTHRRMLNPLPVPCTPPAHSFA